eukprot:GHVU01079596.1.p1 GENE.GHVU01079596.1~~GHVU01079596.1.p1  ORF type:complete len:253 (+),score=34.71 GHVU01079596.1:97-759(+)
MSTALLNCFVLCYCVRISYHQPSGLRGGYWSDVEGRKDELLEYDCESSVFKNRTFHHEGASHDYKDFAKVFPGWETPNLKIPDKFKANWQFQRSFYVEYQPRLAKYWQKKVCTQLPEVISIDDLKPALETITGERALKRLNMEGRREVEELQERWNKINEKVPLSQEQREPIEELLKLTGLCAVKKIALRVYEDVIGVRDLEGHGESKSLNFAFIGNPGV